MLASILGDCHPTARGISPPTTADFNMSVLPGGAVAASSLLWPGAGAAATVAHHEPSPPPLLSPLRHTRRLSSGEGALVAVAPHGEAPPGFSSVLQRRARGADVTVQPQPLVIPTDWGGFQTIQPLNGASTPTVLRAVHCIANSAAEDAGPASPAEFGLPADFGAFAVGPSSGTAGSDQTYCQAQGASGAAGVTANDPQPAGSVTQLAATAGGGNATPPNGDSAAVERAAASAPTTRRSEVALPPRQRHKRSVSGGDAGAPAPKPTLSGFAAAAPAGDAQGWSALKASLVASDDPSGAWRSTPI